MLSFDLRNMTEVQLEIVSNPEVRAACRHLITSDPLPSAMPPACLSCLLILPPQVVAVNQGGQLMLSSINDLIN
jgi:hypothetical protein